MARKKISKFNTYIAYLSSDLVTALARLDVNNFSHLLFSEGENVKKVVCVGRSGPTD